GLESCRRLNSCKFCRILFDAHSGLGVEGSLMKELPKAARRLIREWCATAYERELNAELGKLHELFHQWEASALSPFDLSDAIHRFHDGPARQLYGAYVMSRGDEDWLVA